MELTETKLIIADCSNNRIVMIDDMTGADWVELTDTDLGIGSFYPYDVDYDASRRIYIGYKDVKWPEGGSNGGVIRIDNMGDSTYDTLDSGKPINTIAIDSVNNYIYYAPYGGIIYRRTLEPLGSEQSFDLPVQEGVANFWTTGLAVNQDGMLFISDNGNDQIIKFNPQAGAGSRVVSTSSANINNPMDVEIKGNHVYLANGWGADGYKIMRYDTNLGGITGYGDNASSGPTTPAGEFWYPSRFIAVASRRLYLVDDDYSMMYDRIVGFDDISGAGWQTYGNQGTGTGQFEFYC